MDVNPIRRNAQTSLRRLRLVAAGLSVMGLSACNRQASSEQPVVHDTLTVFIDGAGADAANASPRADERTANRADRSTRMPRTLAFEMAGVARTDDKKAESARQAAIIEAFAQALIEARRLRGQPTSDFTARLGRRLTVIHRSLGDGCEIEISLVHRGEEIRFEVKRGVLQHEPRNADTLARLFDETNGEFALLETRWLTTGDECLARVACYRPVGLGNAVPEALAGHPDDEPSVDH